MEKSYLQTNFSLPKKIIKFHTSHRMSSVGLVKKSLLSGVAFSLNSEKRGIRFS